MPNIATHFKMRAGALLRGGIRKRLEEIKFMHADRFELTYLEDKGWFESDFTVRIVGDKRFADQVKKHFKDVIDKVNAEEDESGGK